MEAPRNRKQRRAAAGPSSKNDEPEIAMAHPPRNDPTKNKPTVERTLYDIIAERQSGLHQKEGAIPASVEAQGIPPQSGGDPIRDSRRVWGTGRHRRRHQQPSRVKCLTKEDQET
ncbi:hypothetical protein N7519_005941 [Penicillium mononematosum]|uniref:uncharacterized protein n=1 Tax=Penicillium mononematosum TaxID=268346 RepID=UPI00254773D8|nr:uncharacterized protein N7519_005941 [Penicillium mononematosum]KAJ6184640.1 hypothetical protein N7519_005941 [Penicillium mononematosum]